MQCQSRGGRFVSIHSYFGFRDTHACISIRLFDARVPQGWLADGTHPSCMCSCGVGFTTIGGLRREARGLSYHRWAQRHELERVSVLCPAPRLRLRAPETPCSPATHTILMLSQQCILNSAHSTFRRYSFTYRYSGGGSALRGCAEAA